MKQKENSNLIRVNIMMTRTTWATMRKIGLQTDRSGSQVVRDILAYHTIPYRPSKPRKTNPNVRLRRKVNP